GRAGAPPAWPPWGHGPPAAPGARAARGSRSAPARPRRCRHPLGRSAPQWGDQYSRGPSSHPHCNTDDPADTDDPHPETLGDRTEVAERDPAGADLALLHDVGDDI